MSDRKALSKAETEVARIVWERSAATVRDVLEALPPARAIDYKTVQTFLRRLEAKGYLVSRRQGRSLVYVPAVNPDDVIQETVHDFIGRLFDGEPLPLVEHLIKDQKLKAADIDRLRGLLDELEQG